MTALREVFEQALREAQPIYGTEDLETIFADVERTLEAYADPRHWAIRRNGTRHPDCIWIGPGAVATVPDGPGLAKRTLEQVAERAS